MMSLVVVGLLYAASFLRQGPRSFLNSAFSLHGPEAHGHSHEHSHLSDEH